MKRLLYNAWHRCIDDEGQSSAEYALILVLLVLAVLVVFTNGVAGSTIELYQTSLQRIVDALHGP